MGRQNIDRMAKTHVFVESIGYLDLPDKQTLRRAVGPRRNPREDSDATGEAFTED